LRIEIPLYFPKSRFRYHSTIAAVAPEWQGRWRSARRCRRWWTPAAPDHPGGPGGTSATWLPRSCPAVRDVGAGAGC